MQSTFPREIDQGQRRGDDVGPVPASEHHQPGAHLRDAVAQLVLRGAPRPDAGRGLRHRADCKQLADPAHCCTGACMLMILTVLIAVV